jgi:tetratricopeptide (TPR) repeat protein
MEFHPIPYGFPNTFSADNLAVLHGMRKPATEILDLATLPEEGREALLEDLDRYYRAGQAFIEARHFKERSAFHGARGEEEQQTLTYQEALRAFDVAYELNPKDASARYLRKNAHYGWRISVGRLQLEQGRLEEAEESFWQAAALENPFKPDLAWTHLGRVLNRRGRPLEALSALERALRHFPKSPDARAERGFARYKLGDMRRAHEDFEAALALPVEPERDAALSAAIRRVANMARKGLLPAPRGLAEEVAENLDRLRTARREERPALMSRLRARYREEPDGVRAALAPDIARSRDAEAPEAAQRFALDVLVGLGDLPGTLDLLRTGARPVRARAADVLGLVKEKAAVMALVEAMADPAREVREAAWAALFVLTGHRPEGYDPSAPEAARAAALEKLRTWWREAEPDFEFE